MKRCGWCGRFVRKDIEPIVGLNRLGERRAQTLCHICGPAWVRLATSNVVREWLWVR